MFTRAQAMSLGFSRSAIDWRIKTGAWTPVDYGVYKTAGTPGSWQQRLVAACLAGPAVASHRSAAELWGFPGFERQPVEVTALRHRRRYRTDVIWHESTRLGPKEVTQLHGIPTTDATRTLIDLGATCKPEDVLRAFDDAVRRQLTDLHRVEARLEVLGPLRRGVGTLRRVLDLRRGGGAVPASDIETSFDRFIRQFDLPAPARQVVISDAGGGFVARVDFAYVDARVVIEIDSLRHHAGPGDWRADLVRQNAITTLGWRVLRFTLHDIEHRPDRVAAAIRDTLRH